MACSTFTFSLRTGVGFVADRRFHGRDHQQLQQMILEHVADDAGRVVVAGAAADVDFLGHGDLHVVDVVAIPDRLEDRVGEPQHEQVLNRFFAEVVIDAVDLLFAEDGVDDLVELAGRREIGAERLFDDHAALAAVFIGQAGAAQLLDGGAVELRGGGEVVDARAVVRLFDVVQQLGESVEVFGVADVAGVIVDVLRELVPQLRRRNRCRRSGRPLWPSRCAMLRA